MPSRCASTGTRASACTRATRPLPPRGTMMSIRPCARSIAPTAARSGVGISCTASRGQAGRLDPVGERGVDRGVAGARFGAAAQDRGIARHQRQRAGIGRHVGAAFVDDADDTQRHAHARSDRARWGGCVGRSVGRPDRRARRRLRVPRPRPPAGRESSVSRSFIAAAMPAASARAMSSALAASTASARSRRRRAALRSASALRAVGAAASTVAAARARAPIAPISASASASGSGAVGTGMSILAD